MEEIITLDGRQFKLTVDRPLTATERAQVLAEIRKQTGCSSCGPKTTGQDWHYGSLATPSGTSSATTAVSCYTGTKGSLSSVTLSAAPMGGVANYTVTFYKQIGTTASVLTTISSVTEATAANAPTTTYTYPSISDPDIAGSVGSGTITIAVPNAAGATASFGPLSSGYIRFSTIITDSCPTVGGGPGWCAEYCDILIACAAPTCNFIVS